MKLEAQQVVLDAAMTPTDSEPRAQAYSVTIRAICLRLAAAVGQSAIACDYNPRLRHNPQLVPQCLIGHLVTDKRDFVGANSVL